MPGMRAFLALILFGALSFFQAPVHAQSRYYNQSELDALLAPIALYPDPLLSQVLMAATYPADVAEAAAWSRANPHLKGEDAVRAAQGEPWDPSVKSMLAFPDVLARMDESPQWMTDLGQAFLVQEPQVMETVQGLRRRAQASGYLPDQALVEQEGPHIAIYPARQFVYVPYYDPMVVYGPWWWPAYRPVYWRPWRPTPVFVSATFFFGTVDWHRRYVTVVRRPAFVRVNQVYVSPGRWRHVEHRTAPSVRPYVAVPEANRQPIVRSLPPALRVESPRREHRRQLRPVPESRPQPVMRSLPPALPVQSGHERREHHRDVRQAQVARPIPPAMRVQPGFERREFRQERRIQPGSAPRREAREGKRWGHRPD